VSNLRKPEISENYHCYFTELELRNFNSSGILYGVIAGMDAWKDADLPIANEPDWDSGTILERQVLINFVRVFIKLMIFKPVGGKYSSSKTMNSGVSAYLG
jgi:hypothetical protein